MKYYIIIIMCWFLNSFIMFINGKNIGYMKGYNEALKERNKLVKGEYMSNFQCPHCGMTNIDCGKHGYKTPKEINYEKTLTKIIKIARIYRGIPEMDRILQIIRKAQNE